MSISCDSSTHKMYKAMAWAVFFLIPVGFPLGIGALFFWRERKNMLWIQVPKDAHNAVYCDYRCGWFVPDKDAEADYGFLFM